jgi:hypothetical protein
MSAATSVPTVTAAMCPMLPRPTLVTSDQTDRRRAAASPEAVRGGTVRDSTESRARSDERFVG